MFRVCMVDCTNGPMRTVTSFNLSLIRRIKSIQAKKNTSWYLLLYIFSSILLSFHSSFLLSFHSSPLLFTVFPLLIVSLSFSPSYSKEKVRTLKEPKPVKRSTSERRSIEEEREGEEENHPHLHHLQEHNPFSSSHKKNKPVTESAAIERGNKKSKGETFPSRLKMKEKERERGGKEGVVVVDSQGTMLYNKEGLMYLLLFVIIYYLLSPFLSLLLPSPSFIFPSLSLFFSPSPYLSLPLFLFLSF